MTKHIGHFLNQDKMHIVKPKYDDDDIQDYVRPWVGLTDEDIEQEFGFIDELLRDCVQRTEAKLKEKNT